MSDAYPKTLLTFDLKEKEVRRVNLPHFDFIEAKECFVNQGRGLSLIAVVVVVVFIVVVQTALKSVSLIP